MITAQQFVDQQRTWLGTPCKHGGREKGAQGGVDCGGLPIGAALELGLVVEDQEPYPRTDRLDNILSFLDRFCLRQLRDIITDRTLYPGEILLIRGNRVQHHIGTWTDKRMMIHPWVTTGVNKVVETPLLPEWWGMIHSVWRVRELEY